VVHIIILPLPDSLRNSKSTIFTVNLQKLKEDAFETINSAVAVLFSEV